MNTRIGITLLAFLASCGPPGEATYADALLQRGKYTEAERAADASLRLHPDDATSWHVKMQALMKQGKLRGATDVYFQWVHRRGQDDGQAARILARTVVAQALNVPSAQIRTRAIQIVEERELEDFAGTVRELLASDNDQVAAAAAVALLKSQPGAAQLATQLLHSNDPKARAIVVAGIARKVGAVARTDIHRALRDPSETVRKAAVEGISRWGGKNDAERTALLTMAGDGSPQVRAAALVGLAGFPHSESLAKAATHALDDSYLGARLAAMQLGVSQKHWREQHLRPLLQSQEVRIALRASVMMARYDSDIQTELGYGIALRALRDSSPSTRIAGLNATAQIVPAGKAIALANTGIQDADAMVRLHAARLLYRLQKSQLAQETLQSLLAHKESRWLAAVELAILGDAQGGAILQAGTTAGTIADKQTAIAAHTRPRLRNRLGLSGLVGALADSNTDLRLSAARALL